MNIYFREKRPRKECYSMFESSTHEKKIKNVQKQESKKIGNKRETWFFCKVLF